MKKYTALLVLASLTIFMPGCKDFLEENLRNQLAPTNTFTSTYGFEVGVAGLYAIARSEYNTWGEKGAYMHNQACAYESLQIGTDICDIGMGDGSLVPFASLTMSPETQFVKSYWEWAYRLIAAANLVLEYIPENNNWDYPETDPYRFEAECRFFRAYAYRTLIYLYGDVPYVDRIEYDFKLDFERDPLQEVLQHIVEDLEYATEHLPDDPDALVDASLDGKLTCWAAYHLLSEMYNFQKEYRKAADAALEVIESGYYELMKTRFGANRNRGGDVFSDMFIENNQNRGSGNMESIYVMQFEYDAIGGGSPSDDWSRRAWNPQYHAITGFTLADSLGGRGLAQIIPMRWWVGTAGTNITTNTAPGIFDAGDIRNSNYNIKRNWYYNDPANTALHGNKCNITEQSWFSNNQLFPAITKFFYGREENLQLSGSFKDRMKFRLAETYLHLAEAYIGLGDAQGAADAINEVRKRAGATLISASDVTLDFLLDERIREMVGEETRRFTLVRTGKLIDRVKTYNEAQRDIIKDYHALWPIPQNIINSNRDLEFPQNPGYGND